ncbi:MAG: glycosyl transferase family 4 [Nanoarchaeota archaeon]
MEPLLLIPLVISFFVSFLIIPKWINKAKKIGLVWKDMNKYDKKEVSGSGGIGVILGFILGVLIFIQIKTFWFESSENVVEILALTTSILILAGIGMFDDLLGWRQGGLSKKNRLILCLFAAIPLMVINAGYGKVGLPFIGVINLKLIYPLIIIPLGIIGASTTFNFLAGFNGLEAGQGILILSALSFVAYITGNSWISIIGLCMIFALLGFLIFNKFPARVFPGDILTYPVGGMIAIMAIIGNFEKIAVFFFIPYILETFLKLRGKLKMQSFGKPNKDGSLELPYKKIYGLEHLSILILSKFKKKVYEKDVVYLIHSFQILIILIGFLIFKNYLF